MPPSTRRLSDESQIPPPQVLDPISVPSFNSEIPRANPSPSLDVFSLISTTMCPLKDSRMSQPSPPLEMSFARPCQYIQAFRCKMSSSQESILPPRLFRTSTMNASL